MPAAKKRPPNLENYVEVADRIELFYKAFPNGSLQSGADPSFLHCGDEMFLVYKALAFRTPDDPRPGVGYAWEPVPGKTPYTRNSELMNAETSAWGRAIAALGIGLTVEGGKARVASVQEVMLRAAEDGSLEPAAEKPAEAAPEAAPATPEPEPTPAPASPSALTEADVQTLVASAVELLDAQPDKDSRVKISGGIKNRLVALGVEDTSGKLPDVIGRIPTTSGAMEFAKWLSSELDALTSDAEPGEEPVPD